MSKLLIAGDILPSEGNIRYFESGDVKWLFGDKICELFRGADFSIVNLEGPLTDTSEMLEKDGPGISASSASIKGIKELGIKAVALANNHITDCCSSGYYDTIKVLTENGIDYVGSGNNLSSLKKYLLLELENKKVCIYNVSERFYNEPTNEAPGANLYDEYIVCSEIKFLKQSCDYLIVIYHGGAEYLQYPTPLVRKRFHRMADCGADFIVSQHTHCIGCEEYYKGSYCLYGQGNFLFARQKKFPNLTKEGLLIEIIFEDNQVKIKKHLLKIDKSQIYYSNLQDFKDFDLRSKRIDDESFIMDVYQKLKYNEILDGFIDAYKGKYPFKKVFIKFFPKFKVNYLRHSYSRKQLLKILNVIQNERRNEDMKVVWKYILNETEK